MPSHLHLIISTEGALLENSMSDFKKHVSRTVIKELAKINECRKEWLLRAFEKSAKKFKRINKYKVWQDGNHPILLDTNTLLDQKVAYIHNNPVEDEIVDDPSSYLYSSARNCQGTKGLIDVVVIE